MHLAGHLGRRARIAPFARHTPLDFSRGLGAYIKLENLQRTGSFKLRGALTGSCPWRMRKSSAAWWPLRPAITRKV